MYQGCRYGQVLLISKDKHSDILQPWNQLFDTELHMIINQIVFDKIELPTGMRWRNKGFICGK